MHHTLARIAAVLLVVPATMPAVANSDADGIDEVTVTSLRRPVQLQSLAGNISILDAAELQAGGHQHPHEIFARMTGTWLSRGSGQEHLTAIRSPVLTGAGSCGGFLFLEDGIPVRPSGFCNVNQMLELQTEHASSIEVVRGPGSALYGSNALHGVVNVLLTEPDELMSGALELGANDFVRVRGALSGERMLAAVTYADDGGFRDDSGYRQAKLHARHGMPFAGGSLTVALSLTDLDQQTAGFIVGQDAYRDPLVNRSNPNPEAFRLADSQRLYGIWQMQTERLDIEIRPYLRHNDMQFLQHFLPGKPLEENGHVSAGFVSSIATTAGNSRWIAGVDFEWSDVFLRQTQFGPTEGSDFLRATRPEGKHYDYDVSAVSIAPWILVETPLGDRWELNAGLRTEYVHYDYRNRMLDGNTRDDGTACGFGGCLYTRPGNRSDNFSNLAPKLSLRYSASNSATWYLSIARGFRAPQMTELYRLQSGQTVADLESEKLDSIEIGVRFRSERLLAEFVTFMMQKRGSVLRDADGFNISNGRSRHSGFEVAIDWQPSERTQVRLNASWASHKYDFDFVAARGETFVSGNDVDTAPRWLGSAEFRFDPTDRSSLALQWTSLGKYYLDAENRFTYPGHDIANVRGRFEFTDRLSIVARLNNALDAKIADRADYAFGNYRYFPGRGRELFVELSYQQ